MYNAVRQKPCRHCGGTFTTHLNFIVYCSLECAFWSKVLVGAPDECWPWQAASDQHGYGVMNRDGERYKAHRLSYALTSGVTLTPEIFVLHSCDYPPCCNPAHLREGTQADNISDAVKRGRVRGGGLRGEAHAMSKLTETAVRFIRSSRATGASLSRQFGVTPTTICQIRKGKSWRHVQ